MWRHRVMGIVIMVVMLLFDQVSKTMILTAMAGTPQRVIEIWPYLNIVLVWNYGISFGLLAGFRQALLLAALAAVISCILFAWLWRNDSRATAWALGFILGGAVGNMVDRLRFGAVIDFIDVHLGPYHWPAFNIADSVIFIGVVLLCGIGMFTKKPLREGDTP